MRFKKRLRTDSGLRQIDIAPLIDCIFLLLIFFMLTSSFVVMPGINVRLPKAVTSEEISVQTLTITISSEDIIYLNGEAITIEEVAEFVNEGDYSSIFIRADRDSSLGTVVAIWDSCKKAGIEKISIASTYQE
ncbi:MAG: biopolymer transporter ExbD [Candidatus Omnitrophota bacterium]